jgi:hypothetical protein
MIRERYFTRKTSATIPSPVLDNIGEAMSTFIDE